MDWMWEVSQRGVKNGSKVFDVNNREDVVLPWGTLQVEQIWSRIPGVLFWTVLSLRCALDIQVEMPSRQLDIGV